MLAPPCRAKARFNGHCHFGWDDYAMAPLSRQPKCAGIHMKKEFAHQQHHYGAQK
jgi:hypothetical protein